jgi:outer membrane receptor protein involved in Fe transport
LIRHLLPERSGGNVYGVLRTWLGSTAKCLLNAAVKFVGSLKRYNLEGSYGHGLEASLDWQLNDRLELRLSGTWQELTARREEDGTRPVLYQRPKLQGALAVDYYFGRDWDFYFEAQ